MYYFETETSEETGKTIFVIYHKQQASQPKETATYIAESDNIEKADFLAKAANKYNDCDDELKDIQTESQRA